MTPSWWMPRFVGERVAAHDRLVRLDGEPGQVADEPARGGDLLRLDAARELLELRWARPQGHHDLLEGGVAGPLAEPVDRDLDLPRAGLDGRQRVGRGEAQVVVAVDADRRVAPDEIHDAPDEPPNSAGMAYPTVSGMLTVLAPASTTAS